MQPALQDVRSWRSSVILPKSRAAYLHQNQSLFSLEAYFHSRFQLKACITSLSTPHHISSGRKTMSKCNSNTDVEFSKSFDWQKRRAQLVADKKAAHSKYLPVPNLPNIWLAQLCPQTVSLAMQRTERSRKLAAGQDTEPRVVMSVFPKEATSFALTNLQLFKTWQADHGSLMRNYSIDIWIRITKDLCFWTHIIQRIKWEVGEREGQNGLGWKKLKNLEGKQGEKVFCKIFAKKMHPTEHQRGKVNVPLHVINSGLSLI